MNRPWMPEILRAPADEAGAAPVEGGAAPAPASDESVLFPNDNKAPEGGAQPDAPPAPAPAVGDWKEFEADPAKSEAENAAAKAEHDKAKPADPAKADVVPEDGKYDLAMPEGFEVDAEMLDALGGEFKELGLTNGQAQKLSDKYADIISKRAAAQQEGWGQTIEKWVGDAKADKEIGGGKWDSTVSASRRAVETLGTPALKEYLNASGGGNHPELIRFMSKVGAMISEDDPASGAAAGSGKPVDVAHSLFPNDAPKG